ncbi:unnamed protein product [Parnassius apollo]|uniref:(apollo) hypothetical protein n=1 Tax=Parnassius apollo TaxID=110799 RepID=A0A8S3WUT4_PARAO|nr:unnamed protein product [Parnassius apollo]
MDCFKCKKNVAERDVIKCTGCNMYMHYQCADLSETEFKKILPMNKIKWKCPPCKNKRLAGTLGGTVSPKFKDCATTSILNVDTDALTEYMDAKLDSLRQQWQEDLNSAIQKVSKTFAQDINRLEKRVASWEERIKELEQNFTASHSPDVTLMQENNELRADLENLRAKFDDLDQASRSCNVELQNIPDKKAENLIHLSIEVGKLIGVDIKASDIRSVHRVAPKSLLMKRQSEVVWEFLSDRASDVSDRKPNNNAKDNSVKASSSQVRQGGDIWVARGLSGGALGVWGLGETARLHAMRAKAKSPLHSRVWHCRVHTRHIRARVRLLPAELELGTGSLFFKIRDNISSWVLWWRQCHLRMGAPQTPKLIEEDECLPRVAALEATRQAQQERKLERRRGPSAPRRRGLENELEGERRRPRRKPRKK